MKNYFNPVSDKILSNNKPLTKIELNLISKSTKEAEIIIKQCNIGPTNDGDVLYYYEVYLTKCIERLQRSLQHLKIIDLKKRS